jgi:toxin ParE1/3/4
MRVHYRERALADLDEIFQYIDKRSPGGARNVIDAISAAVNAIAEHPLGARETSSPHIHVKGRQAVSIQDLLSRRSRSG